MVYKIEKLAEAVGVSRRAVRYYIQRGLLPPPKGKLKGAYYTEEHLERLRAIQELADKGVPLGMMGEFLDGGGGGYEISSSGCVGGRGDASRETGDAPSVWRRIDVADGVELHVRDGVVEDSDLMSAAMDVRSALRRFIEK